MEMNTTTEYFYLNEIEYKRMLEYGKPQYVFTTLEVAPGGLYYMLKYSDILVGHTDKLQRILHYNNRSISVLL